MSHLPYEFLPTIPNEVSSTATLSRLVDGLGFRYHWATADLNDSILDFSPVDGSFTFGELMQHIHGLAYKADSVFGGPETKEADVIALEDLRRVTLEHYANLSKRLRSMADTELENLSFELRSGDTFPFWYIINGQIADALTHVGQLVSWRRIAGHPQPKGVRVFHGDRMAT